MKKILLLLFFILSTIGFSQDYNLGCLACAEANGFYCGDDEANWTQYSPNGCVQNSWINDGWEDCVDASDENGAVPTSLSDCVLEIIECDTVYIDVPVVEYIYETDTIVEVEIEYVYETQYIYDTIIQIEYEEVFQYIDCDTGLDCNSSIGEIIKESEGSNLMYNLYGQEVKQPSGVYIQNGTLKWHK
tara:strand:+ start:814 stop:1377 length:564 start_codon:yes stop_codon:yes gene_type:complete